MHKQDLLQCTSMASQLNSLLLMLNSSGDELSSVDRENLMELAEKMSGTVAAYLINESKSTEVKYA